MFAGNTTQHNAHKTLDHNVQRFTLYGHCSVRLVQFMQFSVELITLRTATGMWFTIIFVYTNNLNAHQAKTIKMSYMLCFAQRLRKCVGLSILCVGSLLTMPSISLLRRNDIQRSILNFSVFVVYYSYSHHNSFGRFALSVTTQILYACFSSWTNI